MANIDSLAQQLAGARNSRAYLTFSPAIACSSAAEAYAVQAAVAGLLGQGVAGWKVGIGPDNVAMAAPILAGDLVANGGGFRLSGDRRSVKVEAELALRLGRDLPARRGGQYSREEILQAVSEVFCGIELVHTRFVNDADVDFASRLADNFAHGAYAVGGGVVAFAGLDLTALRCRVLRDGAVVSDRAGGHPLGDPLLPVMAWAAEQCDRLGGLRAGQFVTTGTLIDPFAVETSCRIEASLSGVGSVSLAVETAA